MVDNAQNATHCAGIIRSNCNTSNSIYMPNINKQNNPIKQIHPMTIKMKKTFGIISLAVINSFLIYLLYLYVNVSASLLPNNIFNIPHEPSGAQLMYYFYSLIPFIGFYLISEFHRLIYFTSRALSVLALFIWVTNFILSLVVDFLIQYPAGNLYLYIGSSTISLVCIPIVLFYTGKQAQKIFKTNEV